MIVLGTVALGSLLLIWIGYPVVVRILGGRAPRPRAAGAGPAAGVSVVLATRADPAAVAGRVANLLRTDYRGPLQVVVSVDGGAAPADRAKLQAIDPRVAVVEADSPGGKAMALNAGVRAAVQPILVFADTDQRFEANAIRELVAELEDPALGAASGMLDLPGAGGRLNLAERYWRLERWLRLREARLHSSIGVTGAIYAMRRALWRPLPAGLILDDLYVPMRLVLEGFRVGYTDRARARDVRRFAPGQEFERKVRTLTGVLQVCAWMPEVLNPASNPVWLQFLFHKVLRLLTPYLAALTVVGFGAAAVAALAASPARISLLAGGTIIGAGVLLVPRARRTIAEQVRWGLALQGSAAVAAYNGLRGRWNVWN